MTDDELAAIEQRAAKATGVAWLLSAGDILAEPREPGGLVHLVFSDVINPKPEDLDFIAHARADVPRMARTIRELWDERTSLRCRVEAVWTEAKAERMAAKRAQARGDVLFERVKRLRRAMEEIKAYCDKPSGPAAGSVAWQIAKKALAGIEWRAKQP